MGYFENLENLEKLLNESFNESPKQIQSEIHKLNKAVAETDEEISSTFKLQLQMSHGTESAQLTAAHLEKLGKQKKILLNRILELEEMGFKQKDSVEICNDIENNVIEFKKGFKKAPPSMRRRLVHKVLGKLVYTGKGFETYFKFDEQRSEKVQQPFEKPNDKIIPFQAKKIPSSNLSEAGESLSLSFGKLLIGGIGWGRRTRTSE